MQKQKTISLKVLRTQSDIIGITNPVQLAAEVVKAFDASNAKGDLRVIESFEKAGSLGRENAKTLLSAMS